MYLRLLDSTSFISAKQHVCRIVNVWDECDVLIKHNPSRWTHPGINALSTSRTFTRGVKLGSLRGEANTAWIGIFWLTTDLMKYVFLVRTNTTTYSFSLSPSVSIDRLQSELHLHFIRTKGATSCIETRENNLLFFTINVKTTMITKTFGRFSFQRTRRSIS